MKMTAAKRDSESPFCRTRVRRLAFPALILKISSQTKDIHCIHQQPMTLFRRRNGGSKSSLDLDPHQWNKPTTEFQTSSKHPQTLIPDPQIFRDALLPSLDQVRSLKAFPTAGHLAVHLALLECFAKFKEKAVASEQLTVLDAPGYEESTKATKPPAQADNARAVQRWASVVSLAASRFTTWFENIDGIFRHAAAYHRYGADSNAYHAMITADYLPPLDVLLVWYCYMNGHAEYHSDNIAHDTPKLLEIPFPWEAILNVIDMGSLTYNLPPASEKLFYTMTSQNANILIYLSQPPPYTDLDPQRTFSLNLKNAVHELMDGDSFVQRMHALLWLRSPSMEGTLNRALAYYAALPEATGHRKSSWQERVSTDPNLELVWRTHMLYPVVFTSFHSTVFGVASTSQPAPTPSEKYGLDDELEIQAVCYCWACERVRDELPEYIRSNSPTLDGLALITPMSSDNSTSTSSDEKPTPKGMDGTIAAPLTHLTKDQISEIKADLAFHHYVEHFRKSQPAGVALPTRPPTTRMLQDQKKEQDSKSRAGRYYGLGYTVEVIRPAVYDPDTGRLLQKEKTRVKRSEYMPYAAMRVGFS